ncbi:protein GRAVITROPIC IN THE LIGHT 1 [Rhodamnia argentea]|uniref:Protein GRAVITROPIC IN THE LIGHT 1 n=1 Tax=Rhodamnia argentea TaxID=178133 RepID=A0A8B8QMQ6_9MYRT|nr:protein GRAVITROPIC IN THE LIGHT 1 [Rhodamnia argentea]
MEEEEEEAVRHRPAQSSHGKSRLARTLHRVINLRTSATARIGSSNGIGICVLASQDKVKHDDPLADRKSDDARTKQRAVLEAVAAKLFASGTAIKAAYAELQLAQSPYNSEAIQQADQAIVDELKQISELKRKFLKKELDLSPQVTLMLAEVQEQQSLMRTYEITVKKMEAEAERKESEIYAWRRKLDELVSENRSSEKKLNASGVLPLFDGFKLSSLSPTHFAQVLHYALRSVKHFAKSMVREMETANWNLDEAIRFIEPRAMFAKAGHRHFAIESFVAKSIFEGFNFPNFALANESSSIEEQSRQIFFDQFKKLKSVSPTSFIARNPSSSFARFAKAKYLQLVHAKMECSFFRNLNHRKVVSSGGWPDSPFLVALAEVAKRVWVLHCLAFAFDEEVRVFQVARGCRFSEVFMECVAEEALLQPPPPPSTDPDPDLKVGFTVVPGFKIGKTVIQCQVYLSPPASAPARS